MKPFVSKIEAGAALVLLYALRTARAGDTPDSWVTMKTKVSLMSTEGIRTSGLSVDAVKGVVTLHGNVATEAERVKAGDVARHIDGVGDVKNLLQVVPESERAVGQPV